MIGVRYLSVALPLLASQVAVAAPLLERADATIPCSAGDYFLIDCYVEPTDARALKKVTSSANMTADLCATTCASSGYSRFFGLEYGKECWCGNYLNEAAKPATSASECNTPCSGNSLEFCGGSKRLQLYGTRNGPVAVDVVADFYDLQGCYTDNANGRVLGKVFRDGNETLEGCASKCAGSVYFGLEYGSECWCGDSIASTSQSVNVGECDMVCEGNGDELCGSSDRLSLYKLSPIISPDIVRDQPIISGYEYQGCYTDGSAAGGRSLTELLAADDMTYTKCADWAKSKGYTYFGLEYGRECWAGNTLNSKSTPAASVSECNKRCAGDASHYCGAQSRLDLYKVSLQARSEPRLLSIRDEECAA